MKEKGIDVAQEAAEGRQDSFGVGSVSRSASSWSRVRKKSLTAASRLGRLNDVSVRFNHTDDAAPTLKGRNVP